jgi:hypothetical protein
MPTVRSQPADGPSVSRGVEIPLEAAEGQAYPNIRRTAKFLLYWTPGVGAYSMRRLQDGTPILTPRIQMIRGVPGLGGVDGGDGRPLDFSRPARAATKRGGVVLDAATMRRHGLPSYYRAHLLAGKDSKGNERHAYLPPWLYPRRTRSGDWTIECDENAKTRWEHLLLTQGVVPMPEPADVRDMLERRDRRIHRHLDSASARDDLAKRLESDDLAAELHAIASAGIVVDEADGSVTYSEPEEAPLPEVEERLDG